MAMSSLFPHRPLPAQYVSIPRWQSVLGDIRQPWVDLGSQLTLDPFEAKALFALGMMRRYFLSANAVVGTMRHRGFLSAYSLMCSGIELLGRCISTDQEARQDPRQHSGDRLQEGLTFITPAHLISFPGVIVETNHYPKDSGGYSSSDLMNLRNLATHGGSISPASQIKADIELLEELRKAFVGIPNGEEDAHRGDGPVKGALDLYFDRLASGDTTYCDRLADAAISPVPVQFYDQGWPFDLAVVNEILEHIRDNQQRGLPAIIGGHTRANDHFQLYP
ncbi:MAG: hypothetical protein JXB30_11100 [Anaerolineae bacterium]|nr:hypothetical protein [Anaerolineae bacterium]